VVGVPIANGTMRSHGASRCWQQLRSQVIADALAGDLPCTAPSSPLALVRREARVLARLKRLINETQHVQSRAAKGSLAVARLASLLDLSGEPAEGLSQLDAAHGSNPQHLQDEVAAMCLLRELLNRHVQLESQRSERLNATCSTVTHVPSVQAVQILDATNLSVHEFTERFLVPGLPCILRGSSVVPRWAPAELVDRLGTRPVPTRRCNASSVAWAQLEFSGSMPFNKFVDAHVKNANDADSNNAMANDRPQVFDYSIWQHCSEVLGDEIIMPRWFGIDLYTHASCRVHPVTGSAAPTLFVAAGGTSSGLHVDFLQTHFWMGLCHGRKRWRLVPREDLALLYPQYLTDLNPSFPFDLDAAMKEESLQNSAYPAMKLLRLYEAVLEAGDIIFVPRGWPHQVENLATSVAISANFIDESNLEAARRDAEILGLVSEDPQLVAGMLREAETSGLPQQLAASVVSCDATHHGEPLRAFKHRHGEPRTPQETQRIIMRVAQVIVIGGVFLCFLGAARRQRPQVCS